MGNNILVIIIIFITFIIIYLVMNEAYKKTYQKMLNALFVDEDAQSYFKLNEHFMSKILIPRKQKFSLDIRAYIMSNDEDNLEAHLNELNNLKLNITQAIMLYQSIVAYYLKIDKVEKAIATFEMLKKRYGMTNSSSTKGLIKETTYMIYVDKIMDVSYLKEIENYANTIDIPISKGLFEMRCAKLYCVKLDFKQANIYLNRAKNNLENTHYLAELLELEKANNIARGE